MAEILTHQTQIEIIPTCKKMFYVELVCSDSEAQNCESLSINSLIEFTVIKSENFSGNGVWFRD